MIGYYVHHVGSGHLHRALAICRELGEPVTGFSSLPAPSGWPGPWVRLDPDDGDDVVEPTARGRLHWAPLGHHGLRSRMGKIAGWVRHVDPRAFVVDVSVEVAVLVRLHGVPVVVVALPGVRGDEAHRLGFDVADAVVGCWPPEASRMLRGSEPPSRQRVRTVGGLSRFPVSLPGPRRPGRPRVVLLAGSGGRDLDARRLERARRETPDWEWTVLDRQLGEWTDDPFPLLVDADVVITHAGQNAVAEVAAARTPAVVVPQRRPHREQHVTADELRRSCWPAVVVEEWPGHGWAQLLECAQVLDGGDWAAWCDGLAAERVASVIRSVCVEARP